LSSFAEGLFRAADDLHDVGARFALVGGLAVSVRVEPRFTRDIDLVVAIEHDAAAVIEQRGFARGRDLQGALAKALRERKQAQ
jgi:ribosomal protein L14